MIVEFAKTLHLNIWDWIAVVISLLSFITALYSLWIAWKTLKSQIQTAKNTMPVISFGAQYESLVSIVFQVIENYIDSIVVMAKAEDLTEEKISSDFLLTVSKINTADIHLELFYENNLFDSFTNEKEKGHKVSTQLFNEEKSPYRIVSEYRSHLESFNQKCQMLELLYVNNTNNRKNIAMGYASYIMKESLELIMHTASITSLLYPEHNIGNSILSYIKDVSDSCELRLDLKKTKGDESAFVTFNKRINKLYDTKAWREIYDTYYLYTLKIMKLEEISDAIATISYCRYKYGSMRDYVVYNYSQAPK